LQGGCYIDEYPYDEQLLKEYKEMLGDNFWGFQMHEWMNNYRTDVFIKLAELPKKDWSEEKIKECIYKKYPFPCLFLESMTAAEMSFYGKPETVGEFYDNITDIYKKRLKTGDLIPCDSGYLAYAFETACGSDRLMPEVGAQTPDTRIQIRYARGMTRKEGRSFGIYYEPWGGQPFSACCYQKEGKNEWGIGGSDDFPFETQGPNGGSSRSLQRRIFLYGYLCGAEFMGEEWGICNVFYDWKDFELSPYGQVKKEFIDFTRKYTDIGEVVTPMAAVLPKDMMVLDNLYEDDVYCGFKVNSEKTAKAKRGLRELFAKSLPMRGTEVNSLKNSDIPDAIDILNDDDEILSRYDYLIDLTGDENFRKKHENICEVKEVKGILREILPCYAEGNAHWLLNYCKTGGYYLTVFNHSGIERSVEKGETELSEEKTTVKLELKKSLVPEVSEGNGVLTKEGGVYTVTIPSGGWAFIKLS
ncbi:MAG: hypothetical protein IJS67_04745, partial [Clostridia bacterium]|nr:hypothetical protein [Clostridia bacterium]